MGQGGGVIHFYPQLSSFVQRDRNRHSKGGEILGCEDIKLRKSYLQKVRPGGGDTASKADDMQLESAGTGKKKKGQLTTTPPRGGAALVAEYSLRGRKRQDYRDGEP